MAPPTEGPSVSSVSYGTNPIPRPDRLVPDELYRPSATFTGRPSRADS